MEKLLPTCRSTIKKLLIFSFLSAPLSLLGQASSYVPTIYSGTYTPITGTLVSSGTGLDDDGYSVNIGFTFNFNRNFYTKVGVSANGYLIFGNFLTPSSPRELINSSLNNGVAAFSRDLHGLTNAELRVETSGTAPNRVFTIQWTHMADYPAIATSDDYNFQILLHEADNAIEVRYGSMNADNDITADVGIKDASSQSSAKSIVSGTNTWATATNTVSTTTGSGGPKAMLTASFKPASGLTYKWVSTVTSLPEPLLPEVMTVYPNPSSGKFRISFASACAVKSIGLYNLPGDLVQNIEPGLGGTSDVDLSNMSSGLYIIKAETGNGLLSRKILIAN